MQHIIDQAATHLALPNGLGIQDLALVVLLVVAVVMRCGTWWEFWFLNPKCYTFIERIYGLKGRLIHGKF